MVHQNGIDISTLGQLFSSLFIQVLPDVQRVLPGAVTNLWALCSKTSVVLGLQSIGVSSTSCPLAPLPGGIIRRWRRLEITEKVLCVAQQLGSPE